MLVFFLQLHFQVLRRIAFLILYQLLRRPFKQHPSPPIATFRANIDYMIGYFDHIHIMLNHQHGIASIHQFVQHHQQMPYILKVKPGCGLIQNIKSFSRIPFGQFCL